MRKTDTFNQRKYFRPRNAEKIRRIKESARSAKCIPLVSLGSFKIVPQGESSMNRDHRRVWEGRKGCSEVFLGKARSLVGVGLGLENLTISTSLGVLRQLARYRDLRVLTGDLPRKK